jgi:carbohydrate-binding DOMON domain-containing protein
MDILEWRLKHGFKKAVYLNVVLFFVFAGLGCTNTRKTTKTETIATTSNSVVTSTGPQGTTSVVTTTPVTDKSQTITTTTETKPAGHQGILSSTVHAIGWVIALPFRLVGGLIGWIF